MAAAPAGLHVGQAGAEAGGQPTGLGQQQQGGGLGDAEQLLGIDRDRIGQLQARHRLAMAPGETAHGSDRPIDVQPDALGAAEGRDRRQRVHRPPHRGARRGHHRQHGLACPAGRLQGFRQGGRLQAPVAIHGQAPQGRWRQAHHGQGLAQGDMGINAAKHQGPLVTGQASPLAGHHQGHQIAQAAATGQHPARPGAQAQG